MIRPTTPILPMEKITIYTDGSCHGNPGPGGWAAVILHGSNLQEISGGMYYTTNNRMELTAVIEALKTLTSPSDIIVVSDSKYVCDHLPNVKRLLQNPKVKNKDLWDQILRASIFHSIKTQWVRGHNGDTFNARCDVLANAEANTVAREKDVRQAIFSALLADHTLTTAEVADRCKVHIKLAEKYRAQFFSGR